MELLSVCVSINRPGDLKW